MSEIKLTADSGGGTTSIKAPSSTTSNADVVLKLPVADGSSGQVLKTDGSGQLSFTSNAGTTINTNGDNRILTGTGTANTIQGESQLLFDSSGLLYIKAPDGGNRYFFGETGNSQSAQLSLYNSSDQQKVRIAAGDGGNAADTFFTGGNVGIGTNSPTAASSETTLNIYANEYPELHLTSSVTGTAAGDGSIISLNNDNSTIIRNQENSYIRFDTNGSNERMRILAGGGITFNGDTAAANALDDYEEGSFTPALSGFSSISYHRQKGQYTKIGRQVWMHIYFYVYQATGDTNVVTITGLPFTSSNADSGHIQNGGQIWYQNDTFRNGFEENGRPYLYIGSNSSYAQFRTQSGGDITGENTYLGSGANNRYITCGLQMIV